MKVSNASLLSKVFVSLENTGISNVSIDKAISYTKPLSQTVGNAIFITDSEITLSNQLMGRVSGVQIRGINSYGKETYEPPKIELKKILVSASVQAKFILR